MHTCGDEVVVITCEANLLHVRPVPAVGTEGLVQEYWLRRDTDWQNTDNGQ